jgi:hypothetical protein
MREVQISVDDQSMNLTHKGVDYRNDNGVITMPENVANEFTKADVPGIHKHGRLYGFSHISDDKWERIFGKK